MGKQSCMYDYQADDEQGEGIWGGGEVDNCKEKRVVMQQIEFLFLR